MYHEETTVKINNIYEHDLKFVSAHVMSGVMLAFEAKILKKSDQYE